MRAEPTALADVMLVRYRPHGDPRGLLVETYQREAFAAVGIRSDFVQDLTTVSEMAGTVRGFHFQVPPFAQAKLVRVLRGRILDVVVDLRRSAPTYGRHVAVEMAAEDWTALYVPEGFAHGFCTLADHTEIAYKIAGGYSPDHARGLAWDDPALGVAWPVAAGSAIVAERDRSWPGLAQLPPYFE